MSIEYTVQLTKTTIDLTHPETPSYPTDAVPATWSVKEEWAPVMYYDHGGDPDTVLWKRILFKETL